MKKVWGLLAGIFAVLISLAMVSPAHAVLETFEYTGNVQTWTVPYGVTEAQVNLYGAQGADGGNGGWARATIPVVANTPIDIRVGGAGGINQGGYNGGGVASRGGGGATDIRIGGSELTDRILIAGGGGGGGYSCLAGGLPILPSGGQGGGLNGGNGGNTGCSPSGTGATQTAGGVPGGTLGQGGPGGTGIPGDPLGPSGGGGGYYGGGGSIAGYSNGGLGGGGSSFGPPGFSTGSGLRAGNGLATAEYTVSLTRNLQGSAIGPGDGYLTSSPAGLNCGLEGSAEHDVCVYTFGEGQPVTVTANPSPGSVFEKWIYGPCMNSTNPTCSTTMNQVRTVSGQFQNGPRKLSLSKAGNGNGSVGSAPSGIECDESCSSDEHDYTYDTDVTLTATPAVGTNFVGWTGACSGTSACSVTMDEIRNVTATFSLQKRTLTVSKFENGSGSVVSTPAGIDHLFQNCSGCDSVQAEFDYGTQVTLNASGATGSDFTDWGGVCQPVDFDQPCTFSMDQNQTAEVEFVLQKRALNVIRTGSGMGSVTSTPGPIDCGAICSATYDYGTEVTLTASPALNSEFSGWSGPCSGTSTCTVELDQVHEVTASFLLEKRDLSVTRSGNGSGSVESDPSGIDCGSACDSEFDYGTEVALTAEPATGSQFTGWTGACSGTSACSVTLDQAKSVDASFSLQKRVLTVATTGNGGGTVVSDQAGIDCGPACSSSFDYGTQVTLTAAANAISEFKGWSGSCAGTSPTCTLTADQVLDATADFVLQKRDLSIQSTGNGQGSFTVSPDSPDGKFDYGTQVTINANPAPGSRFTGWSGDCVGTDACVISMDQARQVTAAFLDKPPAIRVLKTKKKFKAKKPIRVRIRVTEASTVTFRVHRPGKARRGPVFKKKLKVGVSRVQVPRKIRKKFKPGRYVISAKAVDRAGQSSATKRTGFRLLPRN